MDQDSQYNAHQQSAEQPAIPVDINYIMQRVKAVLFDPRGVWSTIKAENLSIQDMYIKYLIPLVAAASIAQYLGMVIVGVFGFRWPIFSGLIYTVVNFVMTLAGYFAGAVIIQALAPKFQASVTMPAALQLLGFSMTAGIVISLLNIIPALGVLIIIGGIYSLYTFYQGLTPMTGVPHEKRGIYFAATFISIIVTMIVLSMIAGVMQPSAPAPDFSDLQDQIRRLSVPN